MPNNQHAARLREMATDLLGMDSDTPDAAALLAGAEALEAVEVAKAALDTFARAYRISMEPFGLNEVDGAKSHLPGGWPTVGEFKQATAALARLEGNHG
jgi:hypothetical protein